jgi:quercetin dioxygenase-like cupin family protein
MSKYTVNLDEVDKISLPGRSVQVLSNDLAAEQMTIGLCEVSPHSSMSPHSHSQEELIYILQGHGYVEVAGKKELIRPGTLIHFPSSVEHLTANESDEVMQFLFCFSPQVVVGSYDNS